MRRKMTLPKLFRYAALGLSGIVLLLVLACGGEDTPTPQPTPTPVDVAAITSALQQSIDAVLRDVTPGLTSQEIAALVSQAVAEATAGQPEPLTAAEVERIVRSAIAAVPTATPQPTPTPAPTLLGGIPPLHMSAILGNWWVHQCAQENTCLAQISPLYNTLMEFNPETPDGTDIRGDLAKSWEVSDDGVTYTFTLHDNATWDDGKPVTAADVVFSLDSMVIDDAEIPRPRTSRIQPLYESSRVIDDLTVEVTTKFPAAVFLPLLSGEWMKIVPKHHFETLSSEDEMLAENINGSGPFKLVEFDINVGMEYTRNENYFKEGRPFWKGMKFFVITESGTVFAAFRSGQLIGQQIPTNNLSIPENERLGEVMIGKGTIYWAGPLSVLVTAMNHLRAPYDDIRVRRALQLATHRQDFVETFSGGRNLLGSPFPTGTWFGLTEEELKLVPGFRETETGEKHPDDISEAQRLMAEAGLADGFKTTMNALLIGGFEDYIELHAAQLRRWLNLDITVKPVEFIAGLEKAYAGDYEMTMSGYAQGILDPGDILGGFYLEDSSENFSKWHHPTIDENFELQGPELDQEKRRALVREAADILLFEDSPYIFQMWIMSGMYQDNRIRNFNPPLGLGDSMKMEHLWCDPGC